MTAKPTLESLAARVEILERQMTELHLAAVTPGTGDWDAAAKAAAELSRSFDFDAIRRQDECDLSHASDHLP